MKKIVLYSTLVIIMLLSISLSNAPNAFTYELSNNENNKHEVISERGVPLDKEIELPRLNNVTVGHELNFSFMVVGEFVRIDLHLDNPDNLALSKVSSASRTWETSEILMNSDNTIATIYLKLEDTQIGKNVLIETIEKISVKYNNETFTYSATGKAYADVYLFHKFETLGASESIVINDNFRVIPSNVGPELENIVSLKYKVNSSPNLVKPALENDQFVIQTAPELTKNRYTFSEACTQKKCYNLEIPGFEQVYNLEIYTAVDLYKIVGNGIPLGKENSIIKNNNNQLVYSDTVAINSNSIHMILTDNKYYPVHKRHELIANKYDDYDRYYPIEKQGKDLISPQKGNLNNNIPEFKINNITKDFIYYGNKISISNNTSNDLPTSKNIIFPYTINTDLMYSNYKENRGFEVIKTNNINFPLEAPSWIEVNRVITLSNEEEILEELILGQRNTKLNLEGARTYQLKLNLVVNNKQTQKISKNILEDKVEMKTFSTTKENIFPVWGLTHSVASMYDKSAVLWIEHNNTQGGKNATGFAKPDGGNWISNWGNSYSDVLDRKTGEKVINGKQIWFKGWNKVCNIDDGGGWKMQYTADPNKCITGFKSLHNLVRFNYTSKANRDFNIQLQSKNNNYGIVKHHNPDEKKWGASNLKVLVFSTVGGEVVLPGVKE